MNNNNNNNNNNISANENIKNRLKLRDEHCRTTKSNKVKESSYFTNSIKLVEEFCETLSIEKKYPQNYLKDNNQEESRIFKEGNDDYKILEESKSSGKEEIFDRDNLQPNDDDGICGSEGNDAEMDSESEMDSEAEIELEQTFFDENIISNEWTAQLKRILDEWPDDENGDDIDYNDNDFDHNISRSYNYCYSKSSDIYCNTNDNRRLIKFSRNNNFDVMIDIDKLVGNMIYNTKVNDISSGIPLYSIGPLRSPFTSEEYCNDINQWYSDANISKKERIQHSNIINKHFPIAEENIKKEKDNFAYRNNDKEYVQYDCCAKGCMVYVGDEINSLQCSKCTLSRYISCAICSSKDIDVGAKFKCSHKRNPRKTMKYRSIKLLIIKLLRYDTFREVINYKFEGADESKYQNYKDGRSYKRNKSEMDQQFENFELDREAQNLKSNGEAHSEKLISICLFLSWFFDGTQLFTSRFANFAPMFISFLNLPSCLKNLNGAGSFLISLFTSQHGDGIEDFLLNDCFIAELQQLAEGMLIDIGDENLYYVQCRLIKHIQDLIGFNKTLKVKNMATSHSGCMFCNAGKGLSVYTGKMSKVGKENSNVKFVNNRHWMSLKDPCRTNGYSQQCCPLDFYKEALLNKLDEKGEGVTLEEYGKNQVIVESLNPCESENTKSVKDIKEFLTTKYEDENGKSRKIKLMDTYPYCWFSSNQDYSHFRGNLLFYPHCDYKTPRGIWKRTTDDDWIGRIIDCQETGEETLGVKGPWPFYQLVYASIETDVSPSDPCHTWKNIFKDCLNMLKSEVDARSARIDEKLEKDLRKATSSSSNKKNEVEDKVKRPWSFTQTDMDCAELYLECILIPENCSQIKLPKIFTQSGYLKITEIITMFTTLLNLILLASTTMTFAYKQYFRMLAEIIIRSKNNNINKKDVDPLFWRSRQWLALSEGLLPISEMTITKHFQPDIVNHIHNQGPISGWHALSGETLVSIAKRKVKKNGGTKYEQNAYEKLFECEKFKMDSVYEEELEDMKNGSKPNLKYHSLYYCSKRKLYIEDFNRNDISNGAFKKEKLNPFEYDEILESVINEIIVKCTIKAKFKFELVEESKLRVLTNIDKKAYKEKLDIFAEKIKRKAMLESSCYRVIHFLKKYRDNFNSGESLYSSTIKIIEIFKTDNRMINLSTYNNDQLLDICSGKILQLIEYDVITLKEIHKLLITNFKVKYVATIMGIRFKGRGFKYSQKQSDLKEFGNQISGEPLTNYLNSCWFKKNQFNSWCKVQFNEQISGKSNCYAQLNYFFNLNCSRDRLVQSFMLASVTCRVTEFPDFSTDYTNMKGSDYFDGLKKLPLPYVSLLNRDSKGSRNEFTSYDKKYPLFVPFNNILKTKVASIGFIERGAGKFISIYCSDDKLKELTKPSLLKYSTALQGIRPPRVVDQSDENFPIEILAFIDISPENLVLPEEKKIFQDIQWIDDLKIKLSSYNEIL